MNKIYILKIDEDWFYGDRCFDVYAFKTLEDARKYMKEYSEALLFDLEVDYGNSEEFHNYIEITHCDKEDEISIYMEDAYHIYLSLEEKDIMKFKE